MGNNFEGIFNPEEARESMTPKFEGLRSWPYHLDTVDKNSANAVGIEEKEEFDNFEDCGKVPKSTDPNQNPDDPENFEDCEIDNPNDSVYHRRL